MADGAAPAAAGQPPTETNEGEGMLVAFQNSTLDHMEVSDEEMIKFIASHYKVCGKAQVAVPALLHHQGVAELYSVNDAALVASARSRVQRLQTAKE